MSKTNFRAILYFYFITFELLYFLLHIYLTDMVEANQ